MRQAICIFGILLAMLGSSAAQQPSSYTAQQYNFTVLDPPAQTPSANVQRTGNPGSQTFYYWIVTNAIGGNSNPAGPFAITQAPNTLNGSNFLGISWAPATNAVTYDVLRTTTPAMPTGACACAVAIGVSGLTTNDQSISLSAYTVNTVSPATMGISLTNESLSAGVSRLVARSANGTFLYALGAGGGTPGGANTQVQFNDSGTFGGNAGLTFNKATGALAASGGITGASFAAQGTTAGVMNYPQGATNAGASPCTAATSICEQAPVAVTSYLVNKPPAAASGVVTNLNNANVVTQGYSGDANHSATVTTGSGTSIGLTSLCSTTFCPAGVYQVNAYLDITTPCGTSGTYSVTLQWTDEGASQHTFVLPLTGTGVAGGALTTTSVGNWGQVAYIIRSSANQAINYATTAVACGSAGPMVGKLYLSVIPVQ